jgi:hypothetical protein
MSSAMSSTKSNTPFFTNNSFDKVTKASDDNKEITKLMDLVENANKKNHSSFFNTNMKEKQKVFSTLCHEYMDYIISKDHPQFTSAAIAVTIEYYDNNLRRITNALDDWIKPVSGRAIEEGGKKRASKSARVNGSGKGGEGGRYISTKENSSNGMRKTCESSSSSNNSDDEMSADDDASYSSESSEEYAEEGSK